ncbi:MAG: Hsp20/alpha crystallin family protein [Candidatus Dormibacteraeota bacterium]|nr:Hsp20/alpha crystallin family protein [Candidatus Dormibacteraeota bacterium]
MTNETAVEAPPANVYESNGQLTIAIPMPGAHHDTIEVRLEGRNLTVQAEARYAQAQQHYHRHEWSVGTSRRELVLPKPVQVDGAKAMLTHGVLAISLPIAEKETNPRIRIEVAEPPPHQDQVR